MSRRAVYLGLRTVMLAIAAAVVAFGAPRTIHSLTREDGYALLAALALLVILLRINVPMLSTAYVRRRHLEPGRLTLELPLMLAIFTIYGPVVAAALALAGYPLAIAPEGRSRLSRRLLDGGAEAFLWIGIGIVRPLVIPQPPEFSLRAFVVFVAFYVLALFAFLFTIWMPLRSLSQNSVALVRLWRSLIRDTRLFAYTVLTTSWAYVCAMIWLRAGAALGLAAFIPLPFLATALRSLHNHRLDLHRLRLARDAVQAMLRARDPLPQMNSLLASLHTPAAEETLQIYAAISPGDALSPLATMGPIPDAEQLDRVRRVLGDLQRIDRPSAIQRTDISSVTAYAVRDNDDRLLGALLVHRPARTASLLSARRFAQAAAEFAPLLRDFRAIAVTQNAASLDVLTGLPNRRSIMADLQRQIEHVDLATPCAVLILDVDHFKSINDTLGHQAGDRCLRAVGSIIGKNIRNHDRAGRIGGEEFVVMMPETSSEMACAVGERLRAAIEAANISHADGRPLTASIGVAVASLSDTVDSLLARADRALYIAKRQGRNRVVEIGA